MRRLITSIVAAAFLSAQTAGAFPQNEIPEIKNFIQKTGWNKKPLKLKDLYAQSKSTLPLEFRIEIERMLEKNPNAELPKIEVRMIKNGKNEDLQLIAQKGKQAATLTLVKRGRTVAELTHSLNGKDFKTQITYADIFDPVRMMSNVYGPGTGLTDRSDFARLLYAKDLALLTPKERERYSAQVRELMVVAEKAQARLARGSVQEQRKPTSKKPTKKTSFVSPSVLKLLVGEEAFAATPTGSCLVMGWSGTYKDGICTPPDEAYDKSKKCYRCGDLWGKEAKCGKIDPPKGAISSPAALCTAYHADANKYDWYKSATSQAAFDGAADTLTKALIEIKKQCANAKNEQLAECQDMIKQMEMLRAANCETVSKWKEKYTDLKCDTKSDALTSAGVPEGNIEEGDENAGLDNPGKATEDEVQQDVEIVGKNDQNDVDVGRDNDQSDVFDQIQCQGLAKSSDGVDCADGTMKTITCRNTGGQTDKYYYCECELGHDRYANGSSRAIRCTPKKSDTRIVSDERPERYQRKYGPRREREEKSWWDRNGGTTAFMGGMLTIGLGFLMYYAQQQQMKSMYQQYYNMYQPETIRLAPPPLAPAPLPTTPGVPTVPTLPGTR